MVAGNRYMILSSGNTDFTALGAATNAPYVFFTATRPASINLNSAPNYVTGTWALSYSPAPAAIPTLVGGFADAFGGTGAARFTSTASTQPTLIRITIPAVTIPIGNTDNYTFSFYCKLVSSTPAASSLAADAGDRTQLAVNYTSLLTTGQWVRVSVTGVPLSPTVATTIAWLDLYQNNQTVTLDFCGVQLEKATSAGPIQLTAATGIVEAVPAAGTIFELNVLSGNNRVPVIPGDKIEAYSYLNTHRCQARTVLKYYDYLGQEIASSENTSSNLVTTASQITTIGDMFRSGIIATVPASAATCMLVIRGYTITNSAEAYIFFARTFLGRAKSSQIDYSPWNSGSGIKQLTASNISAYLDPTSVATTFIADGAITNAKINGTIQSGTYDAETGAGWKIDKAGNCEFGGDSVFRGKLQAATGTFAGSLAAGVLTSSAFDTVVNTYATYNAAGFTLYAPNKVDPAYNRSWANMNVKVTLWGGGGGGGGTGMAFSYFYYTGSAPPTPRRQSYQPGFFWAGGGGEAGAKSQTWDFGGIASGRAFFVFPGKGGTGAAPNVSFSRTQTGTTIFGPLYAYGYKDEYNINDGPYSQINTYDGNAGGAGGESYFYLDGNGQGTKYSIAGGAGGSGNANGVLSANYDNYGNIVSYNYGSLGGSGGTGNDGSVGSQAAGSTPLVYGGAGGGSEVGGGGGGAGLASYAAVTLGTSNGFTLAGSGGSAGGGGGGSTASGAAANLDSLRIGWTGGGNGGAGYIKFEFYDPNSVVLNGRYTALITYLVSTGLNPPTAAR
jgi:hypothetical protein